MSVTNKKTTVMIPYTDVYKEQCFLLWYKASRPALIVFHKTMPKDEHGRVPVLEYVWKWVREYGWHQRADELDAEVARRIEMQAVNERVEMLNRQADVGKTLQEKGLDYLDTAEFDKMADAIRAIIQGAELERSSRGLPTALIKIAEMDDSKLSDTVSKLLNKASSEEVTQLTEGEIVEEKIEEENVGIE